MPLSKEDVETIGGHPTFESIFTKAVSYANYISEKNSDQSVLQEDEIDFQDIDLTEAETEVEEVRAEEVDNETD